MSDDLKTNLKSRSIWVRGLYMLLFAIFYGIAEFILAVLALFQFGCALITGQHNRNVAEFGRSLGRFIFQITQYVTFNSDDRPFPFSPWPDPDAALPGPGPQEGD